MARVTLKAHAKINLALSVASALPAGHAKAGFHPLSSWMTCIDLADTIEIATATREDVSIGWGADAPRVTPIDWPIDRDLSVRALRAIRQRARCDVPVRLRVTKRIPVGGGLGGGSSDAAAAIVGGNQALGLSLHDDEMLAIAATLGSDVSFFVRAQLAHTGGFSAIIDDTGETVTPIPRAQPVDIALVFPPFGCPTGAVYATFDQLIPNDRNVESMRVRQLADARTLNPQTLFNDLESPAITLEPRLHDILASIRSDRRLCAMVTGSGSTIVAFNTTGTYASMNLAEMVRSRVPADCVVFPARIL